MYKYYNGWYCVSAGGFIKYAELWFFQPNWFDRVFRGIKNIDSEVGRYIHIVANNASDIDFKKVINENASVAIEKGTVLIDLTNSKNVTTVKNTNRN